MKRFRVKVCGLTRPKDATLAVKLGVDMIGMIFHPTSPRNVNQKQARELIRVLPPTVSRVGVFVDRPVEELLRVAENLGLDFVQLQGSEPVKDIVALQRNGCRVIKAYHPQRLEDFSTIARSRADLILLDNRTKSIPGGTGRTFDWSLRPRRHLERLMLAGGMNAENLADGVRLFSPLVVDICSGVESRPGDKSPRKLKEFFRVADRIRYGC